MRYHRSASSSNRTELAKRTLLLSRPIVTLRMIWPLSNFGQISPGPTPSSPVLLGHRFIAGITTHRKTNGNLSDVHPFTIEDFLLLIRVGNSNCKVTRQ